MAREKVAQESLGQFLTAESRKAVEAIGARCFALETVREACTKAAREGFPGCVIKPDKPVNVRTTESVKKAEAWLLGQGLQCTWMVARDSPDGVDYPRLEITWNLIAPTYSS